MQGFPDALWKEGAKKINGRCGSRKSSQNVSQIADLASRLLRVVRMRGLKRIYVLDAVWLVLKSISGTPQDEMDRLIENWRRYSKKVGAEK